MRRQKGCRGKACSASNASVKKASQWSSLSHNVVTGTSGAGISASAVIPITAMASAMRAKTGGTQGNNRISINPYGILCRSATARGS